ncbi:hypothetical protein CsatA_029541 [Cannabis sativa]
MVTEQVPVDPGSTNPTGSISETATSTSLPSFPQRLFCRLRAGDNHRTGSPTDVMNYLRGMNGKIENIVTEMQSIRTTVTTRGWTILKCCKDLQRPFKVCCRLHLRRRQGLHYNQEFQSIP